MLSRPASPASPPQGIMTTDALTTRPGRSDLPESLPPLGGQKSLEED